MSESKLKIGNLVIFAYGGGKYPGALRIVLISDESTTGTGTIRGYDFTRNGWRTFSNNGVSNIQSMPCQRVNLNDVPFTSMEVADAFTRKGMKAVTLGDIVYAV